MSDNYFADLYAVNVADKIEKKNGLSYLSWAWAWAELKKRHPSANAKVYENADGWNYFTDGTTAWVKTGVTVNDIEHIEYLPVMDHRNKSIPLVSITSFDVNKAIQRSMTKAIGRHGLGLSIYAGEDIPDAPAHETPAPLDRDMVNTLAAIMTKIRPNGTPYFTETQKAAYKKKIAVLGLPETLKEAELALEEMEAEG